MLRDPGGPTRQKNYLETLLLAGVLASALDFGASLKGWGGLQGSEARGEQMTE